MNTKRKRISRLAIGLIASMVLFTGCVEKSTKPETELDRKVQAQPEANSPAEILKRASDAFSQAPGLNEDQKQKLGLIYGRTYTEALAIRKEIGQSKGLLFQLIASKSYKSAEVEKLKQKIVELDQKRLTIMFKALADVQDVVGYGRDKEEIYKHLRDYEIQGRGIHISERN